MMPASQLATGLSKLGLYLRSRAWRELGEQGASPTQVQVLVLLDQRGPQRVGALAALMGVRQPTLSEAVARLVDKGLVRRRADPEDGRAQHLVLTAAGRRLARSQGAWPDALLGAIEALGDEEQGAFLRALSKIIENLLARGEIPPQRMCVSCRYFRPGVHPGARPHHCDFVDAAFADRELRLDCGEYETRPEGEPTAELLRFLSPRNSKRRAPVPRQRQRAP
jgi:DNA-binding MarR family transcriptional regulator